RADAVAGDDENVSCHWSLGLSLFVIAGLDPAIQSYLLRAGRPWMPGSSPGMTTKSKVRCLQPGLFRFERFLEARNLVHFLKRQADAVETFEQAMLAERVDVELDDAAIGPANFLGFEIDSDDGIGAALRIVHQLVDFFLRKNDGQNAVLEAVIVEDVGKARRDHA